MIRVFIAFTAVIILTASYSVAAVEPDRLYSGDPGEIPGIYCYDYYFLGNKKLDTTLFTGTNPNASFMDKEDIAPHKGENECTTYVVSEKADVNLFDPFFGEAKVVNYSTDSSKILPNPAIRFFDEEDFDLSALSSDSNTVLYGGVLPFVALPDGDLETEDSFFNDESFSLFFYFKSKF